MCLSQTEEKNLHRSICHLFTFGPEDGNTSDDDKRYFKKKESQLSPCINNEHEYSQKENKNTQNGQRDDFHQHRRSFILRFFFKPQPFDS